MLKALAAFAIVVVAAVASFAIYAFGWRGDGGSQSDTSSRWSARAAAWLPCPRPRSHADIRRFRVAGGETCAHARRVLDYAAFGHEGGCCPHQSLGFTCHDRPGGLERNSSGGGYTYDDDWCVRGVRRAAWRIVFH